MVGRLTSLANTLPVHCTTGVIESVVPIDTSKIFGASVLGVGRGPTNLNFFGIKVLAHTQMQYYEKQRLEGGLGQKGKDVKAVAELCQAQVCLG